MAVAWPGWVRSIGSLSPRYAPKCLLEQLRPEGAGQGGDYSVDQVVGADISPAPLVVR